MKVPFVDLQTMHRPIRDELAEAMLAVLDRGDFILGKDVAGLEEEYAAYIGTKYAVGLDNGLTALELSLRAYDIGEGDEVIIPANTFVATAAAVTFAGAKVVPVDINPDTYTIDPNLIEDAITPRTRAIIPVHLYGLPSDMDPIMEIANRRNLIVLEDVAQAHGATYKGKRMGSFGHVAAFSFYPTKNLGALGDAGIMTTNDEKVVEKIKMLRNCGSKIKYVHELEPFNHRLDSIQAAALRVKLRHLDSWSDGRRRAAKLYNELFAGSDVVTPITPEGYTHVFHLYVVRTARRDELQKFLSERGVGTAIHYPIPVHLQPFYADLGYKKGDFPVTDEQADQIVSLPMFPDMTAEQVEYVATQVKELLAAVPA